MCPERSAGSQVDTCKHDRSTLANTRRQANGILLLGQRPRRWASIKIPLAQRLAFNGQNVKALTG